MTATPPSALEGTQAPNPIELLWERYRSLAYVIVLATVGALAANFGLKYMSQKAVDEKWTAFTESLGMQRLYTDETKSFASLAEVLLDVDAATLEAQLAKADDSQRPFLLLAIARKAVFEKRWERAESALAELESKYPNHSLVQASEHPVQAQEPLKPDPEAPPPSSSRKPQFKPAVAGSAVQLVRQQIEQARNYTPPEQFAKPEIPADAPRVRIELSEGYGSFVIALMPQAPLHRDAFLGLVDAGFWKDIAVDELQRPSKFFKQPQQFHLGFESTKDDDRTKWDTTVPSGHQVEFEANNLSHFAGAVSARPEADGKSCADRFWVSVDESPRNDGQRVVFGYVVEGLEELRRVCEATMSAQEEERGTGRPTENIRVVSVTRL